MMKQTCTQFTVMCPNQPGMFGKLTQMLSKEGVNIDCLQTQCCGETMTVKFVCEKDNGMKKKLESAGYQCLECQVFCLELPNSSGELHRLGRMLAEQEVEICSLYGTSHGGTCRIVMAVDEPEKAARVLKETGASLVGSAR